MAGRTRVRNPASKSAIVTAAERVVAAHGAAHLTLDRVAEEAGISKGGLLYNFPTKQALIEGMLEAMVARVDTEIAHERGKLGGGPNATIRSHLSVAFDKVLDRRIGLAILAAGAENPQMLGPVRELFRSCAKDMASDADDGTDTLIVWLAAHTLNHWQMLGVCPFDEETRACIERRLWDMIGGDGEATNGRPDAPKD